jgi:hypothetical protein
MNKLPILAAAGLMVAFTAQGQVEFYKPGRPEDITQEQKAADIAYLTANEENAKKFIQAFYKDFADNATVLASSPFVVKTLAGNDYLVAKFLVSRPFLGATFEFKHGFVIDFKGKGWLVTLRVEDLKRFLNTGDREILGIVDLNPDSEITTPTPTPTP